MSGTTQKQIDDLKVWIAQGNSQINALTPCTTAPPVTNPAGLFTEYDACFLGNHTYYTVQVDANGNPVIGGDHQPVPGSVYIAQQKDATHGKAIWGSSAEDHKVITAANNEQWVFIDFFEDVASGAHYPVETIRAEWINLDTGMVRDISRLTPTGPTGSALGLMVVPTSGRYRFREWFYTCNPDGSRAGQAFWQEDQTFGLTYRNPAWTDTGTQTRQVIKYWEVWWDASGGWTRGHATITGQLPWINNQPNTGIDITYDGWGMLGRGVGCFWAYQYPEYRIASSRTTG